MVPLREELAAERKAREVAQTVADGVVFREKISVAARKVGAKGKALPFLATQAQEVFEIEGGELKSKGQFSTKSPGDPLPVEEWLEAAMTEWDFAFEPSKGGGADTATPGAGGANSPKVLRNPDLFELGRHLDDIASGKVVPVNDQQ